MYLAGVNELQEKLKTQTGSHHKLEVAPGAHPPGIARKHSKPMSGRTEKHSRQWNVLKPCRRHGHQAVWCDGPPGGEAKQI